MKLDLITQECKIICIDYVTLLIKSANPGELT